MNKKCLTKAIEETFEEKLLKDIPTELPNAKLPSDFKDNFINSLESKRKYNYFPYIAALLIVLIIPFGMKYFPKNSIDVNTTHSIEKTEPITITANAMQGTHKFMKQIEEIWLLDLELTSLSNDQSYVKSEYRLNSKRIVLKQFVKEDYIGKSYETGKFVIKDDKVVFWAMGYVFEISGDLPDDELIELCKSMKIKK